LLLCEGIWSGADVGCCYVKAYRVERMVVVMWRHMEWSRCWLLLCEGI